MPEPTPDPSAVIGQLLTFSGKLAEVLENAEAIGGLAQLQHAMKPATAARLIDQLKLLRAEIDEQLAGAKAVQQASVKRRPPGAKRD
jgi:hypothetical protein